MKTITTKVHGLGVALLVGSTLAASAVPITFQVNMGVQTSLGMFSPADNSVEVHGSFNGWGPGITLSVSPDNADIYQATVEVVGATGSSVQFKFVINQAGSLVWENNGVGPAGAQNRAFNLPAAAQTLPAVYFNNQSAPPGVVEVTFQVNMAIQTAIGNFDPATYTVEAHGAFDGWGAGIMLSPSSSDANIYQGAVNITGSPGTAIEHKFVINQAGTLLWEGNVGSGGPFGNRTFTLSSSNQLLPVVYFNNLTNNPGGGIPVTFRVNMGVPIARGSFDRANGTVNLAGPFNNWNPTATSLTNSPTETNVWQGTININTASPGGSVPFKFLMNGTWENGNDRTFVLASPTQTLPVEYFDHVSDFGPLSLSADVDAFGDVQVTVSWTGAPLVRLQSRSSLSSGQWQDVPDSLGQSMMTFMFEPAVMPENRFFRLIGP
jgi:hypothetical protein